MKVNKINKDRKVNATKEEIIKVAFELAKVDGFSAISMRKIADKINYRAPKIYEVFESKDGLLKQMADHAFAHFTGILNEKITQSAKKEDILNSWIESFWQFSIDNSIEYDLMHRFGTFGFGTRSAPEFAKSTFSALRDLLKKYSINSNELDDLADSIWALMHGFIDLALHQRIKGGEKRACNLARYAIESLVESRREKQT